MFFNEVIEEVRKNLASKQGAFSKNELAFITYKDTFRNRLNGFMTSSYYKREKLVNQGFVYYAFAFKEYREHVHRKQNIIPTWVVFSPSKKIDENPKLLENVKDNLEKLFEDKELRKKYRKLYTMVSENTAEPMYFKIPKEFSPDFESYLCLVFVHEDKFPLFHLGINLVIANKNISKEILYLPISYWTKEYLNQY